MKKTCNGCKANTNTCWLGKKTKTIRKIIIGYPIDIQIPDEECPKPMTNNKLLFYLKNK